MNAMIIVGGDAIEEFRKKFVRGIKKAEWTLPQNILMQQILQTLKFFFCRLNLCMRILKNTANKFPLKLVKRVKHIGQ